MKSNQNFGVATHILIYISTFDGEYITSAKLADSINTSPVVVRRILKELANHGLIETKQGKFGSKLNKEACSISLYDVYKVFHRGNILSPSHTPNLACPLGVEIKDLIDESLYEANEVFEKTLKSQTICKIKERIERGI